MKKMKETIENSAYLLSCRCPVCFNIIGRSYQEEIFYCRYCGTKLHTRAFTKEEIEYAIFEREMDNYEDL